MFSSLILHTLTWVIFLCSIHRRHWNEKKMLLHSCWKAGNSIDFLLVMVARKLELKIFWEKNILESPWPRVQTFLSHPLFSLVQSCKTTCLVQNIKYCCPPCLFFLQQNCPLVTLLGKPLNPSGSQFFIVWAFLEPISLY